MWQICELLLFIFEVDERPAQRVIALACAIALVAGLLVVCVLVAR
jgi:hypothetical protein